MIQENDILDKTDTIQDSYRETIQWWERKRVWYNLVGIFSILLAAIAVQSYGEITFRSSSVRLLIFGVLFCNFCYTLGWAGELFLRYWFTYPSFSWKLRWFFLIAGSLFTAFVTFVVWSFEFI